MVVFSWHDDLGLEPERHEIRVLWTPANWNLPPVAANVSRGDVATAMSRNYPENGLPFSDWFATVRDLLLAGF